MKLSDVNKGSFCYIRSLPPGNIRMQALRLGFCPHARALCLSRIRHGPVVLLLADQEIACGQQLAQRIAVSRLETDLPWHGGGQNTKGAQNEDKTNGGT